MRCIFCLEEREPSLEHIFPDAIGGVLATRRVCKPCNDFLGAKVDKHLTDHLAVLMKRHALGIKNRDGETVGFEQILGTGVLADQPEQRIKLVKVPGQDGLQPQLLHRSERITSADGAEIIQITIDASQADEIGKIIQRTRKREGQRPLSNAELDEAVAQATASVRTVERPSVRQNFAFDAERFPVAILKIAYELAWLWLGDTYLDDPTAVLLRDKILRGRDVEINGQIQIGLTPPFDHLWQDENDALIGMAAKVPTSIAVSARIFDVISGSIVVTKQPERYPSFEGRFHLCDPQARTRRDSTLQEELRRLIEAANRPPRGRGPGPQPTTDQTG